MTGAIDIDWDVILPRLAQTAGVLVVAAVVWWLFLRMGRRWIATLVQRGATGLPEHEQLERQQRFDTLWAVLRTLLAIAVGVVAVLVLLDVWGVPLGPFLAVWTVVGVGIGLGAQDYVKSVIAGFMIIVEDQYGIGDIIRIADVSGKVEAIKLRTTVLRDLEGNVHHVPNGEIAVASNLTQGFSAVVIDVPVAFAEDVDRVVSVVADEAGSFSRDELWADRFLEPPQVLGVERLGDWSVDIRVVFTTVPEQRWAAKREFLRRIKLRLDREGIEIPFPSRTIVMREGPQS